jgi:hypothetical protein
MGQLKKWATDTLSADATYTALCIATVGEALNFYRSSPVDTVEESLPFFTAFTDEATQDFTGATDFNRTWNVPFALGISANERAEMDGVVKTWKSTDDAEILAVNAIEVLRKEAKSCGIYGEDVIILNTRLIVTEIGEADDIQANIFLTFGELNHI